MKLWRFAFAAVAIGVAGAAACTSDDPTVIPTASDDASTGDGGTTDASGGDGSIGSDSGPKVDAGPPHFCATQTAPAGAADFFCADFDDSNLAEGFTDASVTDGATLTQTTVNFFSMPNGLASTLPDNDGTNPATAFLSWQKSSAQNLQQLTIEAEVNPTNTPSGAGMLSGVTYVMGVYAGGLTAEIGYTKGAQLSALDAQGYEGPVLHVLYQSSGGDTNRTYGVPDLPTNHWTDVLLSIDIDTGNINLLYDGTTVQSATAGSRSDTVAEAYVGDQTAYDPTFGQTWNFDNVRISTMRAP